jgi:hypothetical protein
MLYEYVTFITKTIVYMVAFEVMCFVYICFTTHTYFIAVLYSRF